MKVNAMIVCFVIVATTLVSCKKDPVGGLTEEESRVYITNRDTNANFTDYKTFSIVDSVTIISNNQVEGKGNTAWDAAIIDAVSQQLQNRGYTLVSRTQNPNLGVNVTRFYNSYSGIVEQPAYWGGYNDFYDPFYWGYGGYPYAFPSYYQVYNVTEGAASIDVFDLKSAGNSSQVRGIWSGLIRGSGIFNPNTIGQQVSALFDQSAYLRANQ
jgi:hypothetical protein